MAQFGGYRTVRELSRTGFAVVYTACRAEETTEAFAVKVYRPSVRIGADEGKGAERQARAFAESADIQRQAATEDPACWAAVHATGATEAEAFYVTDLCRSSLRQVIDGRLDMTAADLRNIVTSIVHGLVALKRACRRPHGNLKPSNVLIASAAPLSQANVVLCDPLPGEYIDPDAHWTADLRELAEFIHELVTHQPTPATKGWQIPESPEWNSLGKQAGVWRDLCNRLLSLDTQPNAMTLEGLLEELDRLPAPRKRVSRPLLAAGVGLAVLIGGLLAVWPGDNHRRPSVAERKRAWSDVIVWVVPLRDALYYVEQAEDPNVRRIYRQAVVPVCRPLDNNRTKVDHVGGVRTVIELVRQYVAPESPALRPDDMNAVNEILTAASDDPNVYDAIIELKTFFFSDVNDPKYKGWPWLKELRTVTSRFNDLGCRDHLEELGKKIPYSETDAVDRFSKGPSAAEDFAQAVKDIMRMRPQWRQVQEDLRRIDAEQQKTRTEVTQLAKDKDARTEDVRQAIQRLEAAMDGIDSRTKALRQLPAMDSMKTYAAALREDVEDIIKDIGPIYTDAVHLRERPKDWHDEIMGKNEIADGEEIVNREWLRRRTYWLGRPDGSRGEAGYSARSFVQWQEEFARSDREGDRRTFYDIKDKVERTYDNLKNLCGRLPTEIEEAAGAKWQQGLVRLSGQKRKNTLDYIVGEVAKSPNHKEVFPVIDRDGLPGCDARIRQRNSWRNDISRLIADYNEIDDILMGFRDFNTLSDKVPGKDKNIGALDQEWRTNTAVWDPNVESVLSDLAGAANLLWQIDTRNDPDTVIALSGKAPDEYRAAVLCAAWWRLRRYDNWPATPEQWKKEKAAQQELAATLAGRTEELRRDFAGESARRHRRIIETIIETEDHDDPTLRGFVGLAPPDKTTAALETLEEFEQIAEEVAVFVINPDWKNAYDMPAFHAEQDSNFPPDDPTPERMRAWLGTVEQDYRVIDDPRDRGGWTRKRSDLDALISKGLAETSDEKDREPLRKDRQTLVSLAAKAESLMSLPPITKYARKIDDDWQRLWQIDVPALEEQINSDIAPAYCRYIEVSGGNVLFKAGLGLDRFKPVAHPGFGLLSLAGLRDFENTPSIRDNFFEVTDTKTDPTNAGWPKYIRAEQDQSVILRFIPSNSAAGTRPFYMALHEITNAQYARFLTENKATGGELGMPIRGAGREIWISRHITADMDPGYLRIRKNNGRFDVEKTDEEHPAVWITCRGAEAYAKWIDPNARLPEASWYRHAIRYNDKTNWHVRGQRWRTAAENWNSYVDHFRTVRGMVGQSPPLGAADQAYCDAATSEEKIKTLEPIDLNLIADPGENSPTHLPRPVSEDDRTRLCNLLGNVWEWCTADGGGFTLCGGSCLSAPDYANGDKDLQYPTDRSNRDVGFRVVVVPRTP